MEQNSEFLLKKLGTLLHQRESLSYYAMNLSEIQVDTKKAPSFHPVPPAECIIPLLTLILSYSLSQEFSTGSYALLFHRFLPQYQKAPPFGSITLTILSLSKDKAGMNEGAIWGFRYGVSSSIPIGSPGL